MTSNTHKKILKRIKEIDTVPTNQAEFNRWLLAEEHMAFLKENALHDELVLYASGDFFFTYCGVIEDKLLHPIDQEQLLAWSGNPFDGLASYATGGGREGYWVSVGRDFGGTKALEGAKPLVLGRDFEGSLQGEPTEIDLLQEFVHIAELFWRPEHSAFCRLDKNGDIEKTASISHRQDTGGVTLVTIRREVLDLYLGGTDSTLVRLFDFTQYRPGSFNGWNDSSELLIKGDDEGLAYKQRHQKGNACYNRGYQLIRPLHSKEELYKALMEDWFGEEDNEHCEYIAHDWRNKEVKRISTDPKATTNYFEMESNSLPHELSPAFFRPEVLQKYKMDRDKYTVEDRSISCRGSWHLTTYDVNEAGQVHTYICYLRDLPYREQLHWLSNNEEPQAGISKRAHQTDFLGQWSTQPDPFSDLKRAIDELAETDQSWWALKDPQLHRKINKPLTASRDEWGDSFLGLSQWIVEGFVYKEIRKELEKYSIEYNKDERSISLLQRLVFTRLGESSAHRLDALREVQYIRNFAKGHASPEKALKAATDAISDHGSFAEHFDYVCRGLSTEIMLIQRAISGEEWDRPIES